MNCYRMGIRISLALAFALAGAVLANPARAGSVCYLVTADTSGISGTPGFLEAQLSASMVLTSPTVTATISNFSSPGGTLGSVSYNNGVTGSFSDPPATMNNTPTNGSPADLQQNFSYGSTFSFEVTLSGSEIGNTSSGASTGTIFSFFLEDQNGNYLSNGPPFSGGGQAFDIFVNPSGAGTGTLVDNYGPLNSNGPTVTITPCAAVPEPSSMILMGLGLGAVVVIRRSRGQRS